jgi:hypothetical protein
MAFMRANYHAEVFAAAQTGDPALKVQEEVVLEDGFEDYLDSC